MSSLKSEMSPVFIGSHYDLISNLKTPVGSVVGFEPRLVTLKSGNQTVELTRRRLLNMSFLSVSQS